MAPPWPSGAQPVGEWAILGPDAPIAELVEVPNGKKLAVSSILFSFTQDVSHGGHLGLGWESVTLDALRHVIATWHFYEMRLPIGPNLQLTFPTPLVVEPPDHGKWAFRLTTATPGMERLDFPKINILTVGYTF